MKELNTLLFGNKAMKQKRGTVSDKIFINSTCNFFLENMHKKIFSIIDPDKVFLSTKVLIVYSHYLELQETIIFGLR